MAQIKSDKDNYNAHLELLLIYQFIDGLVSESEEAYVMQLLFTQKDTILFWRAIKALRLKDLKYGAPRGTSITATTIAYTVVELDANLTVHNSLYLLSSEDTRKQSREIPPSYVVEQLRKLLFKRLAIGRIQRMLDLVEHEQVSTGETTDLTTESSKLLRAEQKLLRKDFQNLDDIIKSTVERANDSNDIVPTGFPFLNRRIAGFTKRAISGLLALPSHMKSTLIDSLVAQTAANTGQRCLIVSLEDPVEERVKRIAGNFIDLSLKELKFKRQKLILTQIEKIMKETLRSNVFIVDSRDVTRPDEVARVIADVKPAFVAVDYLQNFEFKDIVSEIISAVRTLEIAAIRNDCHVMIASQVPDKKIAERDQQAPKASDAQWTSALRQKSAEMFGLFYRYQITKNFFQKSMLEMSILKGRYSDSLGNIILRVDPDRARIIGEVSPEDAFVEGYRNE